MKNILKYGLIFSVIYGAVLLALTIYAGRLMPAEVGFIVPFWFLVKPLLISMASLPMTYFLLVTVVSQIIVAFIQGAIIGIVVNIFSKKNNLV